MNKAIDEVNNTKKQQMIELIQKHVKVLSRKRKQLLKKDDYGTINYDDWSKELKFFMKNIIFEGKREAEERDTDIVNLITQQIDEYELNNPSNFNEAMSPIEYEHYCADILSDNGWDVRVTQASGDQGVDVIASKNNKTIAIQCKMYNSPVGNKAIQEAFTAKKHIGADYAAVVTNNTYTKSAIELANTTRVLLLHHDDLMKLDLHLE